MSFFGNNLSEETYQGLDKATQLAFFLRAMIDKDIVNQKRMLEWGFDIHHDYTAYIQGKGVHSIMSTCINDYNPETIDLLLQYNFDLNKPYSHIRQEPLTYPILHAIWLNCEEVALKFIEHGADLNVSSDLEHSAYPIHLAVSRRMSKVVDVLLEQGADIHKLTEAGMSVFDFDALDDYEADNYEIELDDDTKILSKLLKYGAVPQFFSFFLKENGEKYSVILGHLRQEKFLKLDVLLRHNNFALLDNPEHRDILKQQAVGNQKAENFLQKLFIEYEQNLFNKKIIAQSSSLEGSKSSGIRKI